MNKTISLTIRWPGWRPVSMAVLAAVLIVFSSPGFAAKGGDPGPPTGGETSNNLSIPGILTESSPEVSVEAYWSVTGAPVLGEHFSYACPGEEYWEEFKYPNTSCVDHLMEPTIHYSAEDCVKVDMPCEGMDVSELSRIYWQKEPLNEWWATDDGVSPEPVAVAYTDWGDALEAVSWNERSVIRVETQPWSTTIPDYSPVTACADAALGDPEFDCKVGFQMWHVSGQGITEHWGVRATDVDETVSYNFDSPFQIIKTSNARLNVTKMVAGDALCSQPGGNPGDDPPAVGAWNGSEWSGTCTVYDQPYTVETSVGGKYVYGYNLRMKEILPSLECGDQWMKTGFYRLTFYAPDDVDFTGHLVNEIPNVAPPSVPSEVRALPRTVFNTITVPPEPEPAIEAESDDEDPDADDRLYRPVIDPDNNLTYLDICIVAKSQGGGGGKGGSRGIGRGIGGGRDGGTGSSSHDGGGAGGGGGPGGGGGSKGGGH